VTYRRAVNEETERLPSRPEATPQRQATPFSAGLRMLSPDERGRCTGPIPRDLRIHQIQTDDQQGVRAFVELEQLMMVDFPLFWSMPDSYVIDQLTSLTSSGGGGRLFVAEHDGIPVARCAAIVRPRQPLQHTGTTQTGYIAYLAAAPECSSATVAMLRQAEGWLASRDIRRVLASHNGLPTKIGMTILTGHFTESPTFPLPWNPPYYRDYLESAGYRASHPIWMYQLDLTSASYLERRQSRRSYDPYHIRSLDPGHWADELEMLRRLYMTVMNQECPPEEFRGPLDAVKDDLDPRLVRVVFEHDEPIGFVIGLPDLVPLYRSRRPCLEPSNRRYGFDPPLLASATAVAGGLLPAYRRRHLGSLLWSFFDDLSDLGYQLGHYGPVNDTNMASRRLAERLCDQGDIRYHCFQKSIGC
jgi:hypothetical protein